MFMPGSEFVDMKIFTAPSLKMTDLKVWEEPDVDGVYVLSVDPRSVRTRQRPLGDRGRTLLFRWHRSGG